MSSKHDTPGTAPNAPTATPEAPQSNGDSPDGTTPPAQPAAKQTTSTTGSGPAEPPSKRHGNPSNQPGNQPRTDPSHAMRPWQDGRSPHDAEWPSPVTTPGYSDQIPHKGHSHGGKGWQQRATNTMSSRTSTRSGIPVWQRDGGATALAAARLLPNTCANPPRTSHAPQHTPTTPHPTPRNPTPATSTPQKPQQKAGTGIQQQGVGPPYGRAPARAPGYGHPPCSAHCRAWGTAARPYERDTVTARQGDTVPTITNVIPPTSAPC
jgi:hypothetical protein